MKSKGKALTNGRPHGFKIGQKVHYKPSHGDPENGIVKNCPGGNVIVFVVYHCGGNWEAYQNYTGCATDVKDLQPGWVETPKKVKA